ncbi:MAG: hypothetical protein KBG29_02700 [Pseudomonadales bacterium]|nr:hypothetical protein [Pseudomonadales bacterium]
MATAKDIHADSTNRSKRSSRVMTVLTAPLEGVLSRKRLFAIISKATGKPAVDTFVITLSSLVLNAWLLYWMYLIVFLAILNLVNVAIPMMTVKTLAQVATWLCQLMLSMARSGGDEHGE